MKILIHLKDLPLTTSGQFVYESEYFTYQVGTFIYFWINKSWVLCLSRDRKAAITDIRDLKREDVVDKTSSPPSFA